MSIGSLRRTSSIVSNSHRVHAPSDGYDLVASSYDGSDWQKFWTRNEQPFVQEILDSFSSIKPIRSGLDLGSGTGRYAQVLAKYGASVLGMDISEGMLAIAQKKNITNTRFFKFDIQKGVPIGDFDVCIAARVLSHVIRPEQVSKLIMTQTLSEDGLYVVTDIHPAHRYTSSAFKVGAEKVHIYTEKHEPMRIVLGVGDTYWFYRHFFFKDLLKKPTNGRLRSIDRTNARPIWYCLVGTRSKEVARRLPMKKMGFGFFRPFGGLESSLATID